MTSTRVYDVATGQPASPPLRPGGVILSAAFAPDGREPRARQLAAHRGELRHPKRWGEARVTRWDWQSGRMIGPPTVISDDPWEVCYSPDGKLIAVTTALSRLVLIESATGKVLREGETGLKPGTVAMWGKMGARVCFSPDGKRLHLDGDEVGMGSRDGRPREVRAKWRDWISRDGRWTLKGTAIWDTHSGKLIAELPAHPDAVFASRFSPDGTRVLTGCRDGAARLWDWRTGRLVCPPLHHAHEMFDVGFTPDGKFLATASIDGTARVWEVAHRPARNSATPPWVPWPGRSQISPDGRWLTVGGVASRHPGIPVFDLQDLSPDPRIKPDELQCWSELVACQRIHETGNIENLAGAEWLARWKACRHLRTEQPSIDWSPQSQADWHDRQALAFESAGDEQAEIWHLDRLVERQPRNPQILRRRGRAYDKAWSTRRRRSRTCRRRSISIRPMSGLELARLGRARFGTVGRGDRRSQQGPGARAGRLAGPHQPRDRPGEQRGRRQSASMTFPRRCVSSPRRREPSRRGLSFIRLSDSGKKALADFEQMVEIDPDEPIANNDLAWFLATSLDASLRDPKRAVELARKAVQLAPEAGGRLEHARRGAVPKRATGRRRSRP